MWNEENRLEKIQLDQADVKRLCGLPDRGEIDLGCEKVEVSVIRVIRPLDSRLFFNVIFVDKPRADVVGFIRSSGEGKLTHGDQNSLEKLLRVLELTQKAQQSILDQAAECSFQEPEPGEA